MDHYRSDVFIFGLVVLETLELDHQHTLFNYNYATFNRPLLERKLAQVQQQGFSVVHEFLQECLREEPEQRPDWKQL